MRLIDSTCSSFPTGWGSLVRSSTVFDALYTSTGLEYQKEYHGLTTVNEISALVADDSRIVCGLIGFHHIDRSGKHQISCCGLPLQYVECRDVDSSTLKKGHRMLRAHFRHILERIDVAVTVLYRDYPQSGCISYLSRILLELGAEARHCFSQVIDLSIPISSLRSSLSKSYKWSVNWGTKNLDIKILDRDTITFDNFKDLRLLHLAAAGRATRSDASWHLQYLMVKTGDAFCVAAYREGQAVAFSLFMISKLHCYYGVSASLHEGQDRPFNHVLIWTAIEYAKTIGVRYFEMGEQIFQNAPDNAPSEKLLGISRFKRGFGGQTWLSLVLRATVDRGSYFI